jgi:Predicted RNA-binding protein
MNKEESIIFATKYLEDILSFFGVNLAIRSSYDEDVIELSVPSTEFNAFLIGKNAETLRSLQYLVSMALHSQSAELTRVNVDIADYKKQRQNRIAEKAEGWIRKVRDTGEPFTVGLNAADRRVVHKLAQDYSDIETHSEGEGIERKLTISRILEQE